MLPSATLISFTQTPSAPGPSIMFPHASNTRTPANENMVTYAVCERDFYTSPLHLISE